jgi:hypothetical protein
MSAASELSLRANPTVARGCGSARKQGGTYLECGTSPYGHPIEAFIFDPPIPYKTESARGVTLKTMNGVTHVIDQVGQKDYPFASDILMEIAQHGLSRLVSPSVLQNASLTAESRIFLVHTRGILTNAKRFKKLFDNDKLKHRCKLFTQKGETTHLETSGACSRHPYAFAPGDAHNIRGFTRSTSYRVAPLLKETDVEPTYISAIIGSFPITFVSIVAAPDNSHEAVLEKLKNLDLPKGISAA